MVSTGRKCSRCNILKEWSLFHRRNSNNSGRASICKECKKIYNSGNYTPKGLASINPEGRNCKECEEFKPWNEYGIATQSRSGHKTRCKDCESTGKIATQNSRSALLEYAGPIDTYAAQRFILGMGRVL